jgi:Protein of unknown function (DUF4231)
MDNAVIKDPASTAAPAPSLEELIQQMPLTDMQRQMLRSRWLDQLQYMSGKADQARGRYYQLRFIGVVGGVLVPAFISLSLAYDLLELRIATFIASLIVATVAATELLLRYGERWRHYRQNAELLKSEGWQYLMGIGPYRRAKDADAAFKEFNTRIEAILQQDIQGYMESIARMTSVERHDVFTKL